MRRIALRFALAAVLVSIVALPVFAAETAAAKGGSAAVLVPAGDLKWSDDPEHPGVKVAPLHGDPNTGPAHFFIKLPAGFSVGMHFHSADHWVAVISGTMTLTPEGGAEKKLTAGSGFGFTGKKKHTTACAAGADCVLFVDALAKWDVVPVESK